MTKITLLVLILWVAVGVSVASIYFPVATDEAQNTFKSNQETVNIDISSKVADDMNSTESNQSNNKESKEKDNNKDKSKNQPNSDKSNKDNSQSNKNK